MINKEIKIIIKKKKILIKKLKKKKDIKDEDYIQIILERIIKL